MNPDGALNIADLNDRGGAHFPAQAIRIIESSVVISDLRESIQPDEHRLTNRLELPNLFCQIDPQDWSNSPGKGGLRLPTSPDGSQTAKIDLDGQVAVPRLKRDTELAGRGSIHWENINLGDFSGLIPGSSQVRSWEGLSRGSASVNIDSDLAVNFDLEMTMEHAKVQLHSGEPIKLFDTLTIGMSGRWDPTTDRLEIRNAGFEVPEVSVSAE